MRSARTTGGTYATRPQGHVWSTFIMSARVGGQARCLVARRVGTSTAECDEQTGHGGDGGGRRLSGRIDAQSMQPPSTSGNTVTWAVTYSAAWVLIMPFIIIPPQEMSSVYVDPIQVVKYV
jgi:hypothetical protein